MRYGRARPTVCCSLMLVAPSRSTNCARAASAPQPGGPECSEDLSLRGRLVLAVAAGSVPLPVEVAGALPVLAVMAHELTDRGHLAAVFVDGIEPDRAHPLVVGIELAAALAVDQQAVRAVAHE